MDGQQEQKQHRPYNDAKNPKILTFFPTMEEFRDFEKYIDYMESCNAHLGGIAKVVPPKEWKPCKSGYGDLDDKLINAPILQNVKQTPHRGAYEVRNTEQDSMTVKELRRFALERNMVYSFAEEMEEIERNFWKQLTINPPIYGADSSGTLFDEDVQEWNISNLPSVLQTINEEYGINIQGVNTPYLYFGMWRAFFGWHTEDMDLYSINYIHDGAAKFWYGLAPHNGHRFERMAASLFPESAKVCSAFLRHKTSMISHSVLKSNGIPFNKIMQHEGEFIVTFPHAYHAGFNCGLNVAESTNFATRRWIDYGKYSSICSCREDNVKIDMGIFIKKYRPAELASWNDGTERGKHPEDERASKRPPTSGPSSVNKCRKAVRQKKNVPADIVTQPKQDDSKWTGESRYLPSLSFDQKRGYPGSDAAPSFVPAKRSCAGTIHATSSGRLDMIMHKEHQTTANKWQIPPPIELHEFYETVSERVCRGRYLQPSPEIPVFAVAACEKQVLAGTPDQLSNDEPLDMRCPARIVNSSVDSYSTTSTSISTSSWIDVAASEVVAELTTSDIASEQKEDASIVSCELGGNKE